MSALAIDGFPTKVQEIVRAWPKVSSGKLGKDLKYTPRMRCLCVVRPIKCHPTKGRCFKMESSSHRNLLGGAPVVLVAKPDRSKRFCVDYRCLNAKTHMDVYPMPHIHNLLESM